MWCVEGGVDRDGEKGGKERREDDYGEWSETAECQYAHTCQYSRFPRRLTVSNNTVLIGYLVSTQKPEK